MTKHYELIDTIPRNIYLAKMFTDLPFIYANVRKYGRSNSSKTWPSQAVKKLNIHTKYCKIRVRSGKS